ncbi:helix-turn-helix transcriptional regulator [Lachnospiraceae bacterium MD329]|nr:helix-turn-helix transcriptional regulator [Lachnospiraceae bacterium MD329]
MEFKDLIKKRRHELGLTLAEVGKITGVSKATVLRWESGEIANIRRDKIEKLAQALQTTPAYLMGWEESAKTSSYNLPDITPPSEVDPDQFVFDMYKKLDIEDKAEVRGTIKHMLKADKYSTEFAEDMFKTITDDITHMIKKGNSRIK